MRIGNPLKILEAIDRYKSNRSSLSSSSVDFTFTDGSLSESRSEGLAVLEDENQEEMLAKLKEEEDKGVQSPEKSAVANSDATEGQNNNLILFQ